MTPQNQIATELLTKFPKSHTKTLARIAFRDNPTVFKDLESARRSLRYRRGATGNADRASCANKQFHREPQRSGDPFRRIPKGLTHFNDWGPLQIDGRTRALVLSDIHIPYHDRGALVTAIRYGRQNRVDTVILNGDTCDFFSVSRWEKDPRKRKLKREIETAREFLATLRQLFPKARIIFKIGNHEERWESYLSVKAPELLGVDDFELGSILKLNDQGIELVGDKRPIRLGQLNLVHGHEYKFAISNPVNAARGLFLRAKAYAMCGHFHQSSYHTEKTIEQKIVATWSTGCLCEMHPDYAPLNNWAHGFAVVDVFPDGKFEVQNRCIRHGKVY
jgi:predicted phosphodiesterase